MRLFLNSVIGLLTLAYPFAVYFSIQYFEPRVIAAALVALLSIRLALSRSARHWSAPVLLAGILFCGFAIWTNRLLTIRFYPVLISLAMLGVFAWSLLNPPTIVEKLARLQHPDLPPEGVSYTRKVTIMWCAFFVINGSIALVTALWTSFEIWSLYNGLISYLLMGLLFAGEYLVRIKTQKHVR